MIEKLREQCRAERRERLRGDLVRETERGRERERVKGRREIETWEDGGRRKGRQKDIGAHAETHTLT